jgi:Tfp pilus assembly protein PilV
MKMLRTFIDRRSGFGLVESLVSMGIAAVGLLAVAGLLVVGAQMQASSRDGGVASSLATTRLEQLRMLPQVHPSRQVGGSLANNVATHSEVVMHPVAGRIQVRWVIATGPAQTLDVTVQARPDNTRARAATLRGLLWR